MNIYRVFKSEVHHHLKQFSIIMIVRQYNDIVLSCLLNLSLSSGDYNQRLTRQLMSRITNGFKSFVCDIRATYLLEKLVVKRLVYWSGFLYRKNGWNIWRNNWRRRRHFHWSFEEEKKKKLWCWLGWTNSINKFLLFFLSNKKHRREEE